MSADRRYAHVAFASLAVAVAVGVWIRASLIWPQVLGPVPYLHALHAHSHLALFGWATAGIMGLFVRDVSPGDDRLSTHALFVGAASALAFVGFLQRGYDAATIAIATLHVALWIVFVVRTWRRCGALDRTAGPWHRTALGFLAAAGATAMLPGIASASGLPSLFTRTSVELFLTTLVGGWVFVGSIATLPRAALAGRAATIALLLIAVGVVPSALARVAGIGLVPATVGRIGLALTGTGSLLVAATMLRVPPTARSGASLLLLAAAAGTVLKGAVELLAALTPLGGAMFLRPVAIGWLHLVLLGISASLLLVRLAAWERVARPAAAMHVTGLAIMLAALGAMALGELGVPLSAIGIAPLALQHAALAGSAASAVALLAMVAGTLLPAGRARAASGLSVSEPPLPAPIH